MPTSALAATATFARQHFDAYRKHAIAHFLRRARELNKLSARIEDATARGISLELSDSEMGLLLNPTGGDVYPQP